jgi:hypothetical protein
LSIAGFPIRQAGPRSGFGNGGGFFDHSFPILFANGLSGLIEIGCTTVGCRIPSNAFGRFPLVFSLLSCGNLSG